MYCARPVSRSPSVYRIVQKAPQAARNASFFPTPFFPRSTSNELAPFFRLLDDFTNPRNFDLTPAFSHHARQVLAGPTAPFNPRFDVREVGQNYELRGELPGLEGKDLEVEFTGAHTLIVRGRTEREYTSGTPSAIQPQPEPVKAVTEQATEDTNVEENKSDAGSNYSTGSYQKPTIEDDDAPESSADAQAKATVTPPESTTTEQPQQKVSPQSQQQEPTPRYWVSERSTGSFQRVFNFPSRVDQEAVRASLKNGILSIVVPKAAPPTSRRINVE